MNKLKRIFSNKAVLKAIVVGASVLLGVSMSPTASDLVVEAVAAVVTASTIE